MQRQPCLHKVRARGQRQKAALQAGTVEGIDDSGSLAVVWRICKLLERLRSIRGSGEMDHQCCVLFLEFRRLHPVDEMPELIVQH